jgi:SPASM domain peptide maturase of grasp-with-spasm system
MTYFILFSNCIPVKGQTRSIISDLFRAKYYFIPNDLFDIISKLKTHSIKEIHNTYGPDNKEIIEDYLLFLEKQDLGFYTSDSNELKQFPEMDLNWDKPSSITNSIIEINKSKNYKEWLQIALKELENLGCECIEFRIMSNLKVDEVKSLLNHFNESRFTDIRLVFSHYLDLDFKSLINSYIRVSKILIFNSPKTFTENVIGIPIIYLDEDYDSHKSCGNIDQDRMLVDLSLFTESIKFNNCLNRKISINSDGEILNCPSLLNNRYGNIKETSLTSVVLKPEFQRLWNIKKDDIIVCSTCEFRYMCIDCRAFVDDPADEFSKPLKCGYNPLTNEWSDWSKNPLKANSLQFYNYQ